MRLPTKHRGLSGEQVQYLPMTKEQPIGTLRSNDDGNENVKKAIILKTTLQVNQTFLHISLPFLHDYDVKMPI